MEKKKLIDHLNDISEERGYMDFQEATEKCWTAELEEIVKEAGNRFLNQNK